MQGKTPFTPGAVALLILSIVLFVAGGLYWELVKGLATPLVRLSGTACRGMR
ncbi:hypothetical protein [uncultured Tateyamaria sp.]|uniref:hypothetical protein n=1 Tax=uncultured Tateyamaria sp. TaxID=455651 RepID=UPI002623F5CC|nr:hypothetical protein [uncultured Tateyamaria sp.]